MKLGTTMPKVEGNAKKATLAYKHSSAIDLMRGPPISDEAMRLAQLMQTPSWRLVHTEPASKMATTLEEIVPRNMRHPKIAPAWLKHDKQVLRFNGYFQEMVVERSDEQSRIRHVTLMYHMEDGTIRVSEPRVENSGIPQGSLLKRHRIPRPDGQGFLGPDDLRCGMNITLYGRTYHISSCDRFTRWFYEENGIDVGQDEAPPTDTWTKSYEFRKLAEKGGLPMTRALIEAKSMAKYMAGGAPQNGKFAQFLLNDRKVLRFKAYWDDTTLYGVRTYFVIHYYLCDNTCEINEAQCRNSGRDVYPMFMKRGPLYKKNETNCVPAMLQPDVQPYMPEDMIVGQPIYVWNRKVILYDCDEFTQNFYMEFLGIDQTQGRIDVSEKPVTHKKLAPPPHHGVGSEEDSLISCQMIQIKPPKVNLVKLMTLSGEVCRFEAKMTNGEPEDEQRRFVIAFYPAEDKIMVSELQQRNSGHMAGKFADKRKVKNPETGRYFELTDFFVGKTVTIAAQPLQIIRADEHCLRFLEARPNEFPYADPVACAKRLEPLATHPELNSAAGVDPDRLKELADLAGTPLVDHEVITLLRRFPAQGPDGSPRVSGPAALLAMKTGILPPDLP